MQHPISIAIETSCRAGGAALGAGEELIETVDFAADRRHAVQLVARLADLLGRRGLAPADLDELYVSVGPGSFTGLRVGITVARTLAGALPDLRCVAVPTADAVAENAASLDFRHLVVVMDAARAGVYVTAFAPRDGRIVRDGRPQVLPAETFLRRAPRPILLIGEGLAYHPLAGDGVSIADERLHLPTPEGVWHVGRRLARAGRFDDPRDLVPLYLRKPEAVRLWELRHSGEGE